MKIQCTNCGFSAQIDESKKPAQGNTARCPKCNESFVVFLPVVGDSLSAVPGMTVAPQRQDESKEPREPRIHILQIFLGAASAVILSIPLLALVIKALAEFKMISDAGDIGIAVMFMMLLIASNSLIAFYGSAISYKKSLAFDSNCLLHVLAAVIISQAVFGGGIPFRLTYAVYAVFLLFFASWVMFLARRYTLPLLVVSSISLLGLTFPKAVSKTFNQGGFTVKSIFEERKHKAALKQIDEFWTQVFSGRIAAGQIKQKRLQPSSSQDENMVIERKILSEKPHLKEDVLDVMVGMFTGTSLGSDERVLCSLLQLPDLPDRIVAKIAENAYQAGTVAAVVNSDRLTPEIVRSVYGRSGRMEGGDEINKTLQARAKNEATSPAMLAVLARGNMDNLTLRNVAGNRNTPPDALTELVRSSYDDVAEIANNHPSAPQKARELFYLRSHFSPEKALQKGTWEFVCPTLNEGRTGRLFVDTGSIEPAFENAVKVKTLARFDKPLPVPPGRETSDATSAITFAYEHHYVVSCGRLADAGRTPLVIGRRAMYEIRYDKNGSVVKQSQRPDLSDVESAPKLDWQKFGSLVCK